MLKMYFLAGIRGSLAATGSDEGGPTGKCRSVRSRPPPIHCHEQEPDHVLLFFLRAASLTGLSNRDRSHPRPGTGPCPGGLCNRFIAVARE